MLNNVSEFVNSIGEQNRRAAAAKRIALYYDDYREILRNVVRAAAPGEVALQLEPFLQLVGGSSFLKRISDELARPLYARDALRRVMQPGDGELKFSRPEQDKWQEIATEIDVDCCMDLAARLLQASSRVYLFPRVIKDAESGDAEFALDIMTRDMTFVIPDPDRPHRPIAWGYITKWSQEVIPKPLEWVCWDDEIYFSFQGKVFTAPPVEHDYGMIPVAVVGRRMRPGMYDDDSCGADLEAQSLYSFIVDLVVARKVWTQQHIQLAHKGDIEGFPEGQILNEKSILHIGGGPESQLLTLDLQSDPSNLLKVKAANEASVAANYGIGADRLNQQKAGSAPADDGLQERVAEMAQIMYRAERDLFEVLKVISKDHPKLTLAQDDKLIVDLGYVHNRTDRMTVLAIRAEEKRQGVRDPVDDVLEDNPEFGGDEEIAMEYLKQKAERRAAVVELMRELNAPADGEPGMSPEQNGARGPVERDAKKAADAAATERAAGMSGVANELRSGGAA